MFIFYRLLATLLFLFIMACTPDTPQPAPKPIEIPSQSTPSPTISDTVISVTPPKATLDPQDVQAGLAAIEKSDCLTCHKVNQKLIGPSYQEVANRYWPLYQKDPEVLQQLMQKIKQGGKGNWGAVAMAPHPQLSDEALRQMALYVLSLHSN